jgi:hypothetical protein
MPPLPKGGCLAAVAEQRRVHKRPALDDETKRVELTVRLRKQRRRKAELIDRLAETPNRGVVRRLYLQRQPQKRRTVSPEPPPSCPDQTACATAAEAGSLTAPGADSPADPVSKGVSAPGSPQRPASRTPARSDLKKSADVPATAHERVNERRLGRVTARHRRITLFGRTSENQIAPTSAKNLILFFFPAQ